MVEGVRVELRASAVATPRMSESSTVDGGSGSAPTFTTSVTLYENAIARGTIALADTPRPQARAAIESLHALGLTTVLCSGDRLDVAQSIARELNITTVLAPVLPQEKLAHLQSLQLSRGPCLMLGDGLNDAPALAAADVGVAMGTGTDAAQSAGHVVLLGADLAQLPTFIRLARATMRRIHQTLAWAMLYNAVLIPVAAWGILNPMLAAGAMSLSSMSVVVSALWLRRARID
jgi:Cu+-exporting ATPase